MIIRIEITDNTGRTVTERIDVDSDLGAWSMFLILLGSVGQLGFVVKT